MGDLTGIAWTHHTFNGWWGCIEVSPACDHCYARQWAGRWAGSPHWFGDTRWGPGEPRHLAPDRQWDEPRAWDRKAQREGVRRRVFASSMCDVFDLEAPQAWRERLYGVIRATPSLDWLLLTKRVGNVARMLPADWGDGYPNVWLGATVATQSEYTRDVPRLLRVPAAVRFLSCEPLLEPLELAHGPGEGLHWLIVGGESGEGARLMPLTWAHDIVAQCRARCVAPFVKQLGAHHGQGRDKAGSDMARWPEALRVRKYPQ